MSAKSKNSSTSSNKLQNKDNISGSNISTTNEVKRAKKTRESSNGNKYAFANITHKNSSGATNWAKFAETINQFKGHQPSKKPLVNKNHPSVGNVNVDKIPSCTHSNTVSGLIKSQNNHRPYFKTPDKAVSENTASNSVVHSVDTKSEIPKPILTKHIAMDCEMVGVEIGVNKNMLARVSLVNSHGDCIYDKFVKPTEPVLDYRTRVSGVRPKDLKNATDFKVVQKEIADMLKGRILVGHALKNDLKVLYLSHPRHLIRDTARYKKFREGKTPALKKLAKKYLGVTIQEGEHSSIQDALAAMQLYKMFKKEWESSIFSKKHQNKKGEKDKPSHIIPKKSVEVN